MGDDPKTSVVNRWQQAHDVTNLFVMDGAVYPSSACQNPTADDHGPGLPGLRSSGRRAAAW